MTFSTIYLREHFPASAKLLAQAEDELCHVARLEGDDAQQLRAAEALEAANHKALDAWLRSGRSI